MVSLRPGSYIGGGPERGDALTPSLPDDLAARVRRLPAAQQRQALAYVQALEHASAGGTLLRFVGTIPATDLAAMAAAIQADCERVDAADW